MWPYQKQPTNSEPSKWRNNIHLIICPFCPSGQTHLVNPRWMRRRGRCTCLCLAARWKLTSNVAVFLNTGNMTETCTAPRSTPFMRLWTPARFAFWMSIRRCSFEIFDILKSALVATCSTVLVPENILPFYFPIGKGESQHSNTYKLWLKATKY